MYQRRRNLVRRQLDNRLVNVARPRGQLFVCAGGCCCGRTQDGFPAVPVDLYHSEWERRGLRNVVHLTIGGCLGPCALANVALLLFDGQALWFHSLNGGAIVFHLYDWIARMLDAGRVLAPPPVLAERQFTASAWQERPDGEPVDDVRLWRHGRAAPVPDTCIVPDDHPDAAPAAIDRLVADMGGAAAAPRKNGELVFAEPWQGRAFGLAVALHEQSLYPWDDFRDRLIAQIAAAEANGDQSDYYERWLAALEALLTSKGIVSKEEIEERTFAFEFGERDDVF